MLFDSLDKLKRNSIMSAILLVFLGAVIIICPRAYIPSLTLVFGYALVVISIVLMLRFMSSKKSLMEYIKFSGALILGIVGLAVLVYRSDIMRVLAWLFAFLLVLDGGRTMFHSFTYARRSQRKGWWVLTILSVLLIATGIVLFLNPWWNTPVMLMKAIGCAVFFSAIVSGVRLIWTWPLRNSKGGNDDGKE
jgi:uncharacterized membrane protein HdeD (DUF308 family)